MALDPSTAPSLASFKALSFDVYGTLIDWDTGLSQALTPLISKLPDSHPAKHSRDVAFDAFHEIENGLEASSPTMLYNEMLAKVYLKLAEDWKVNVEEEDGMKFANALGTFPAHPDTVEAMQALKKHYKLIALSNVWENGIAKTIQGPLNGVEFDAVLTAESIGSYKPDLKNFHYLLGKVDGMGVKKEELLHVAVSVPVDHVPAKQMGLRSAWISRRRPQNEHGFDGIPEDLKNKVAYEWRWHSLGDMAKDVEHAFKVESQK